MVRRSTRGFKRSHSAAAEVQNEVANKKIKVSAVVKKSPAPSPQSKRVIRNAVSKTKVSQSKLVTRNAESNANSPQSKRVTRNAESATKSPSKNVVARKPTRSKGNVKVVLTKLPTPSSPARETRANKSFKPAKTPKLESDGDEHIGKKNEPRLLRKKATNIKVEVLKSPKKTPAKSERQLLSPTNGRKVPAKVKIAQKLSVRASRRLSNSPKKDYARMQVFGAEVANNVKKISIANKLLTKKPLNKGNQIKNARPKRTPPTKRTANQIQNKKNVKRRLPKRKKNISLTPKIVAPNKRRSTTVKRNQRQLVKRVSKSVKQQNGIVYSEADVQIAKNSKLFVNLEKLQHFEDSDTGNIQNDDVAIETEINGDNSLANDGVIEKDDADKDTTEDVDAAVNDDAGPIEMEDVDTVVDGDAAPIAIEDADVAVNGDAAPIATEDVDAGATTDAVLSTTEDYSSGTNTGTVQNTTEDVDANDKSGIVDNNDESVDIPDNINAMDDASEKPDVLENATTYSTKDFRLNLVAEELDGNQDASQEEENKETSKLETKMVLQMDDSDDEKEDEDVELIEVESNCQKEQTAVLNDVKPKDVLVVEEFEDPKSSTSEADAADLDCDPIESVEDIVAKLHGSVSETLDLCETHFSKTKKTKKETTTEVELKITYSKCHVQLDSDEEKQLKTITVKSEQLSTLKTMEEISDCSNEIETFSASLKAQVLRRYVFNPNCDKNEKVSFSIVSYDVGGQKDHQDLINEIILLKPSILCLQNINESYFKNSIECGLRLHNYNGVFTGLTNGENGLAMFYHTSHFELIQNSGYKVNNLLNKEIQDMAISNLEKEQLLSFLESEFDQANIIKVKSKVNGNELTICSVNLASTNELIVGIQASTILSEVLRGNCKDYIICGAFHLEEDSYLHQFLKGGSMNIDDFEEVKKKFSGDDVTKTDLLRSLLEGLQKNCKDLKSSYTTILGHELCFPLSDKRKIKNSIWFSNSGLQIRNVLDAIAKSPLTDNVLESHISLKSEFQFI